MVNSNNMIFVDKISFRMVGESIKNWADFSNKEMLNQYLNAMKNGEIECLTLYGRNDERLFVIGKPDFYCVTIFIDESEGLGYNDGTGDSTLIEIAGDYWASFSVCKDFEILKSIAHSFLLSGIPSKSEHWLYFSDDE